MKKIEIEDDLYKYILANIEAFGETPSQILRRLLLLPNAAPSEQKSTETQDESVTITIPPASQVVSVDLQDSPPAIDSPLHIGVSDTVVQSVTALFANPVFKNESVVTNKFKMLLTTMYYEKKAAFIVAANTTKGRTRDYFGQNLNALLASDNEEEVALLKASKPRDIPHTPFWVITNANTGRKRIILTQMMASMGYPEHLIERIKEEI
ncbi:MAG: negative modulator of initiation of replication [Psychromonas sp.]|jgi:negative modulator of initiation of replication|uniref:replication initiation regulator SeqA n=1 Tax=Psychromonas sp. TaxID=1884585 RepID=UPI0039E48B7B